MRPRSTLSLEPGRAACLCAQHPHDLPPLPVNGVVVSGLPAPSTKVKITYPDTLLDELNAATGEYLLYPDPGQAYSDSGVDAFLERLYKTTDGATAHARLSAQAGLGLYDGRVQRHRHDQPCHVEVHGQGPSAARPSKAEKYGNAIRASTISTWTASWRASSARWTRTRR